jgi:hypothetical protein
MNIRILLLAFLLLCAAPAAGQGVDLPPHKDPRRLTAAEVDPKMWPIVSRINQSNWVWTTESCEGHGAGRPVVLGLVTNNLGRLFQALAEAQLMEIPNEGLETQDPAGGRFMLAFFQEARVPLAEWQIRLVGVGNQELTRAILARFADKVNRGD